MLLELKKVSKFFGRRCILKNIDANIMSGTITLLVGANGAGKSTLLRIMSGLSNISSGDITWHVPAEKLGYLGHDTFLYPTLTAWDNLQFWANAYGNRDDEMLMQALKRVGLGNFAFEKAGVFSRGMAQRLNLARILLLQPTLWLLDEPCTGLDTKSAELLRNEIKQARDNGAGIVWISHDKDNDARLADKILTIEKSCVISS